MIICLHMATTPCLLCGGWCAEPDLWQQNLRGDLETRGRGRGSGRGEPAAGLFPSFLCVPCAVGRASFSPSCIAIFFRGVSKHAHGLATWSDVISGKKSARGQHTQGTGKRQAKNQDAGKRWALRGKSAAEQCTGKRLARYSAGSLFLWHSLTLGLELSGQLPFLVSVKEQPKTNTVQKYKDNENKGSVPFMFPLFSLHSCGCSDSMLFNPVNEWM